MKIILDDVWYGGVHYDHVEIIRNDINNNVDEQTITNAIVDFFSKDKK